MRGFWNRFCFWSGLGRDRRRGMDGWVHMEKRSGIGRLVFGAAVLAGLAVLGGFLWTGHTASARQASIAGKILRLHVLANSDSREDQELKLKVRDGILAYMSLHAPDFSDVEEAKAWTADHMEPLLETAEAALRQEGCGDSVTIELTRCYFPVKTYGDLTFPKGEYEALQVKIGAAEGQNWWCVMYPPLCFTDATCGEFPETSREILEDQLTQEEYLSLRKDGGEEKKRPEIRFKLLDMLLGDS